MSYYSRANEGDVDVREMRFITSCQKLMTVNLKLTLCSVNINVVFSNLHSDHETWMWKNSIFFSFSILNFDGSCLVLFLTWSAHRKKYKISYYKSKSFLISNFCWMSNVDILYFFSSIYPRPVNTRSVDENKLFKCFVCCLHALDIRLFRSRWPAFVCSIDCEQRKSQWAMSSQHRSSSFDDRGYVDCIWHSLQAHRGGGEG